MAQESVKLYYKIGEACRVLDIQPYVLRYWETEFPSLQPNKSRSGQRVYTERELAIIRRIKELLYHEGYTIAGAKKKLESEWLDGEPAEEGVDSGVGGEPQSLDPAPAAARAADPDTQATAARPRRRGAGGRNLALRLDTTAEERIETLRRGLRELLDEARALRSALEGQSTRSTRSGRGAAW